MTIDDLFEILHTRPQDFPSALAQYLSEGGDINARDKHEFPLIVFAAEKNNLEAVKLLLENSANPDNDYLYWDQSKRQGCTALHFCQEGVVINDMLSIIDLLMQYGANINVRNEEGVTPLIFAASYWRVSTNGVAIVNKLIEHKANVNLTDRDGCPPILEAVKRWEMNEVQANEVVRILVAAGADPEALLKYSKVLSLHSREIESIKKYRPKLFEILREYHYIIPTPSSGPYDPETAEKVAEHNLIVRWPLVDQELDQLKLYEDVRNIIYSYLSPVSPVLFNQTPSLLRSAATSTDSSLPTEEENSPALSTRKR